MSNFAAFQNRPLNGNQRSALGILFKRAYQRAVEHFAHDDMTEKDWRHAQCRRLVGCTISEAINSQYKMLKMYGEDLCGNSGRAFAIALQMPDEMTEFYRGQVRDAIERWSSTGITNAYVAKIMADKFNGKKPEQLTPWELEQTLYTINNRGKAKQERKDGTFDGSRRNKKQREQRRPARPATTAEPELATERQTVILLPWTN